MKKVEITIMVSKPIRDCVDETKAYNEFCKEILNKIETNEIKTFIKDRNIRQEY